MQAQAPLLLQVQVQVQLREVTDKTKENRSAGTAIILIRRTAEVEELEMGV